MRDLLDWLASLPPALLYGVIMVAAFTENLFPPLPADSVIALGAFAVANGRGTLVGAWLATMLGNLGGAMLMFGLGKRFGMPFLQRRFPRLVPADATARFAKGVERHGLASVFVSRFVPGVRALVPPVAGALGVRAIPAALVMTVASGLWYGVVCYLAFRAGENAHAFIARVGAQQRVIAIAAACALAVVFGVVWWRRRAATAAR